ncbi:hypothetical protein PIB30_050466 [Stylosanthes scabra]|uniref:Uncharacterized protein n=1 Tax=Stylosanthes scabra TaxID=79078 RepID=A0ABU6VHS2_9FABA|nr:hypothetical protein [Stylosanthes scabra]
MWVGESGNKAGGVNNARNEDSHQTRDMRTEKQASRRVQGEEDNVQVDEELRENEDRSLNLEELHLFQKFRAFLNEDKGNKSNEQGHNDENSYSVEQRLKERDESMGKEAEDKHEQAGGGHEEELKLKSRKKEVLWR